MLNAGEAALISEQTPVSRDESYFLEHVFFQVEDTLFSLPKYHFANSQGIFATTFTLNPESGKAVDGSSETQPFVLPGVVKEEFRSLLKILHPLLIPPDYDSIQFDEWVMILKLSTMWHFRSVRDLAIKEMSEMHARHLNAFHKIILGKEYHVRKWLKEGCVALVTRFQSLSLEEGELLGLEMTIRISQVREQGMQRRPLFQADSIVEQVFRAELASQQAEDEDGTSGS